jgi:heat shock protein HtpX
MSTAHLDAGALARHKLRNMLHSWLLIGGSLALLVACAWALAGPVGVVWAVIGGAVALGASLQVSPAMVLRLYNARPISEHDFPKASTYCANWRAGPGCRWRHVSITCRAD